MEPVIIVKQLLYAKPWKGHSHPSKAGVAPQFHRLDNECSGNRQFDETTKITNSSSLTIIAATALNVVSGGKESSSQGWSGSDKIPNACLVPKLSKALSALNLMRCISAYAAYEQLFGKFDINRSLAPPGIKVVETPSQRATWSPSKVGSPFLLLQHLRQRNPLHSSCRNCKMVPRQNPHADRLLRASLAVSPKP
jgi:hypothetical protein